MIVVTGASGQLGTAFRRGLGTDAVYLTHAELDLAQPDRMKAALAAFRPAVVLNCAAYTAVDRAESEPAEARTVNADAVGRLAEMTRALGARLVTFSTDYVFDGSARAPYTEASPTRPVNEYGRSKRLGEEAALAAGDHVLIVRTSWLLSGTHDNFATAILKKARAGGVRVVDDQVGRPTLVDDLVAATLAAVHAGANGVLHLTNGGPPRTWFDVARSVLTLAGADASSLTPCSTADYPTAAPRPAYSVLDSARLDRFGLEPIGDPEPGLERAVKELLTWL